MGLIPSNGTRAWPLAVGAVAVAALFLAACGDDQASESGGGAEGAVVVATTSILGDIAQNVVGDCTEVTVLMPPGTDPHSFEPSARQAAELREADLIVANGLGLEESLEGDLDGAAADGTAVIEIGEDLDPIPFSGDDHDDEADPDAGDDTDADDHGSEDPHVWWDPQRMAGGVEQIADAVVEHTSCDPAQVEADAGEYLAALAEAEDEMDALLDAIPEDRRVLVTNHDSLGYLADRFGFEVVGTVIPSGSTLAEPSSAELGELAAAVEDAGVPAIFAETTQSTELADALAAEIGNEVQVVTVYTDALGDPGSGADTYLGMLVANATTIADALQG